MDAATPTSDKACAKSFGLPGRSLCTLRSILASQGAVEQAIVYGSRAKGNFRPGSDIDNPNLLEHIARVGQVLYERARHPG